MEQNRKDRFIDPSSGLRIATLVDGACRHPQWYTLDGTFAEAVAFLHGYYMALERCSGEQEQKLVTEWFGFCRWLMEKLGVTIPERVEEVTPGIFFLDHLRRDCRDDQAALERLDDWWAEYWSIIHGQPGDLQQ